MPTLRNGGGGSFGHTVREGRAGVCVSLSVGRCEIGGGYAPKLGNKG
jgi:hypothetical protein